MPRNWLGLSAMVAWSCGSGIDSPGTDRADYRAGMTKRKVARIWRGVSDAIRTTMRES